MPATTQTYACGRLDGADDPDVLAALDAVAAELNGRPRKTLEFMTTIREVQRGCCTDPLSPPPISEGC
jgi:hypothetical protein